MDVCDAAQNSDIEDETDDEWWLVPVKQEQDLDPAANDCTTLSVTHLVPYVCRFASYYGRPA